MKRGKDYIGVGVGAMIFDDQGRLFLAKRGHKARNERAHWDIPGGSIEFGETRVQAIVREVKEEHGIDIEVIEELQTVDHLIPDEGQHWITTCFITKMKDMQQRPQIIEPHKCDEIGWFELHRLPSPLAITMHLNLQYYRRNFDVRNTVTE